jgi:hypothetical protein
MRFTNKWSHLLLKTLNNGKYLGCGLLGFYIVRSCKRLPRFRRDILPTTFNTVTRGSSVGITTCYGLDGTGIKSRWGGGEIFRTCSDRPWIPPSLLYNGYRVFPGGKQRPGRDADPSPPSSAVGQENVELYLYSPYGPYGLYRASVPVQG